METKNVYVFDADDTLWMLEWLYSKAYSDFFLHLYRILGNRMPNLHSLQEKFFKFEENLYKDYGVRKGRISEAMVKTYREICRFIKWRFSENVYDEREEAHIKEIGNQPFDYTKLEWLSGAKKVLTTLRKNGHILCLLSSYDKNIFPDKADFLDIYKFFPKERVLPTERGKTKEDFIKVSGWNEEKDRKKLWYAVGNGESDILPALEISENWRGIYIPHGSTSKFFKRKGELYNTFMPFPTGDDRIVTLRNIEELIEIT